MTIEWIIIVIQVIQTIVFGYLFIRLKHSLGKERKVFDTKVDDINKLNTKVHDRMVAVSKVIKRRKPIGELLEDSLLMNGSRLEKHDVEISKLINELIRVWNGAFDSHVGLSPEEREVVCLDLIKEIKSRVDALVK